MKQGMRSRSAHKEVFIAVLQLKLRAGQPDISHPQLFAPVAVGAFVQDMGLSGRIIYGDRGRVVKMRSVSPSQAQAASSPLSLFTIPLSAIISSLGSRSVI